MIISFTGKYRFLSNFYPSPIRMGLDLFPTVEHFYQAMKTHDPEAQIAIRDAATPGIAKRLGRKVSLAPDWERRKEHVMLAALRSKFANPQLKQMLIATYPHKLVEGNTWHDNHWGQCSCSRCRSTLGKNRLGNLIEQVRAECMEA